MILDEILKNVGINIDLDKRYLDLKLVVLTISHIPLRTVKEMCQDHGTVSDILKCV